jgi:hypothetical protein
VGDALRFAEVRLAVRQRLARALHAQADAQLAGEVGEQRDSSSSKALTVSE